MSRFLLIFLFCSCAVSQLSAQNWVRKDESAFFPRQVLETVSTLKSFPAFWWNFLVFEGTPNDQKTKNFCTELRNREGYRRVECQQSISDYMELVESWVQHLPLRQTPPSLSELTLKLSQSLAKASLPMPRSAINVLRTDPLEEYRDLQNHLESKFLFDLKRENGFFYDSKSAKIVIPIQFEFPPTDSDRSLNAVEEIREAQKKAGISKAVLVGPHGSSVENREQVNRDLTIVSFFGVLSLLLLASLLYRGKMFRVIWLLIPVAIGISAATAIVVSLTGSIHGLTLSFGVGLVGLSLDYAFHLVFAGNRRETWKANALGLVTTLIVLLVLTQSTVPIMKQVALFSLLGLLISVFFLYLFTRLMPKFFHIELIKGDPSAWGNSLAKKIILAALLLPLPLAIFLVKPDLSLRGLEYRSAETESARQWFRKVQAGVSPLYEVERATPSLMDQSTKTVEWAKARGIGIEALGSYLPTTGIQEQNLGKWQRLYCKRNELENIAAAVGEKFFTPFVQSICGALDPFVATSSDIPVYLASLNRERRWLTIWFPRDVAQAKAIQEERPVAETLSSLVDVFPQILANELKWMGPLSLACLLLVLFLYYRSVQLAILVLLPFVCGLSLIFWAIAFGLVKLSFVTCVSIIMICGLSVDYGVFAVEAFRAPVRERRGGVSTALLWAGASTMLGFLPLCLCAHPVLNQLGRPLLLGTLGTLVGSLWGIPLLCRQQPKES